MSDRPAELVKRRFIAGAICPQCRQQDTLQIEYWRLPGCEELQQARCCVACEFREAPTTGAEPRRKSLATLPRTRRAPATQAVEAQAVRLVESAPKPGSKDLEQ